MRITIKKAVTVSTALALITCATGQASFANEPEDAHTMAHKFANAHKNKKAIQVDEVEGAFKVHSQESDFKTTDQILDSIEARTKAIEALLDESTSDKWNVYVGKPDNVVVETTPNNKDWSARIHKSADPNVVHPVQPDQPRDITELPEPRYALGGPASLRHGLAEASSILSTATVLLKMKPGDKGLRRFRKTADPVLCGRRHCYMSAGFDKKAERLLRGTTLGPFNTLGRRAGACRQKLTCVFRHVDLIDDGVLLQPVDLKFMRHDRRAYRNIKVDPTCKISAGRLHCANPIKAKTWTAWIVPEHIAVVAGSDALETALQDGLPETPIPTVHVEHKRQ